MATRRTDSPDSELRVPRSPIVTPEGLAKQARVSQPNAIGADSLRPVEAAVKPSADSSPFSRRGPDDGTPRDARIAKAAYYRAERRGFAQGGEIEDWLAAEQEIDGEAP